MRRLKKLIKYFSFEAANRSQITFNGVRIDSCCPGLRLPDANQLYSTAADLNARTWVTNPKSAKQWAGFECECSTPDGTSVGFKLSDGTTDYYWDGAAWSAAGPSDWNTEEDVANNISTFPISTQSLAVIVNLVTTDPKVSPVVFAAKVLFESDLETLEDLIFRSLLPELRSSIRPIGEAVAKSSGAATVALVLETDYGVVSIDSVYNLDTDPDRLVDLFQSYNSGTKTVTLTSAQPANNKLLIRFVYSVEVSVTTGRDYTEIAKVPAIVVEDYKAVRTWKMGQHESVLNKAAGSGWQLDGGEQYDLDLPMLIVGSKEKDTTRIGDELRRFFGEHELFRLRGVDEDVRLQFLEEVNPQTYPTPIGLHTARVKGRIRGAVFYLKPAKFVYMTKRMLTTVTVA